MASNESEYWWRQLSRDDGTPLPPSVIERITWYERQVRRKRTGYYAVELVILLTPAAIPAAAAAGASTAIMGVLGRPSSPPRPPSGPPSANSTTDRSIPRAANARHPLTAGHAPTPNTIGSYSVILDS